METKKQTPVIRFKGFKEEWEEKRFGEIAEIRRGLTYKPSDVQKTGVKVLRSSNIYNDIFVQNPDDVYVKEDAVNIKMVNVDDILITSANGSTRLVGKHALVNNLKSKAVHGGFMLLATTDKPSFINASMSSKWYLKFISRNIAGGNGAIGNLSKSELEKEYIALPSDLEQTQIGNYFKHLDQLIHLQEQKLKKVINLKKSMLEKMFPKENTDVPEIRFKGFSEKWEKKQLGEVVNDLYNGQTPSRMVERFWNGNINWLSSGELNRSIVTKTIEKITVAGKENAHLRIVPSGTFILAIKGLEAAGTRGNCAILGVDTTLNQSCMAIYPNIKKLNTHFLFQWYRLVSEEIGIKYTQGTKQQSFNTGIIKKINIMLPKVEEQQKIGAYFQNLDQLIANLQVQIDKLKNIKQAMLDKMFI